MTPNGPSPVFPADLSELTPDIVQAALAERTPGVAVDRIEIVAAKRCGEGVASTADRVEIAVFYGDGADCGLPERMVLKTMLASPHAPAAMYENEVRFYRELRSDLDIETPAVFASTFDPATGRFGLLMEDLRARNARFPSVLDPVSLDEVRSLLGDMATLHARFWDSHRFAGDLAWIGTPVAGGMADVFEFLGLEMIEDQVRRHPFKADLIAPLGRTVPELWELLGRVQRHHAFVTPTLLHGDPHVGNTYLLPGDRAGLLDWQLMMRGSWAHDVTYLIITSLDTATRRVHERDLLGEYLERLEALGVADAPSPPAAFEQYRTAALWGLVIGWLICPPDNYGQAITEATIGRLVTAVADLDTTAAIEQGGFT